MKTLRTATPQPRLRAPARSGQILFEPSADQCIQAIATHRTTWQSATTSFLGMPLHQLARHAREHLLDAAFAHTRTYHRPGFSRESVGPDTQIVASGHQPHWFHPGVWFKNFVLHRIATAQKAVGIHLIIDNDLAAGNALRVPGGTVAHPKLTNVPMDRGPVHPAVPFEARHIGDPTWFAAFPQRVHKAMHGLMGERSGPLLLDQMWPHVIEAMEHSPRIDICMAQARHQVEIEHGIDTLEVPLSHLCDHPTFLQFAATLMSTPQSLATAYADAVTQYRSTYRLRSRSHPAPLLEECVVDGERWIEVPFWIWSRKNPTRHRLFVRAVRSQAGGTTALEFSPGQPQPGNSRPLGWTFPICAESDSATSGSAGDGADNGDGRMRTGTLWHEQLTARGLCLRPRALMTTMFARVFLCDLFLHGIGGARYDQVTNQLIESQLGIPAPQFATATATWNLPVVRPMVDADDLRRINGCLRELEYHPETMIPPSSDAKTLRSVTDLKKKKKKLLGAIPPRGQRKRWHDELQQINTGLSEHTQPLRAILQQQRSELIQQLRNDQILGSREFAFCLFPQAKTAQNLLDMASLVS